MSGMSLLGDTLLWHIGEGIAAVEEQTEGREAEKKNGCNHTRAQHVLIAVYLAKDIVLMLTGLGAHKIALASLKGIRFDAPRMFAISRMMPESWKKGKTVPAGAATTVSDLIRSAGENPEDYDIDKAHIVKMRTVGKRL